MRKLLRIINVYYERTFESCFQILTANRLLKILYDQWNHALQYFQLSVYNNDGSPLTIEQLEEQLNKIVDASTQRDVGVGILTSDGRNNWGRAAKILMKGNDLELTGQISELNETALIRGSPETQGMLEVEAHAPTTGL